MDALFSFDKTATLQHQSIETNGGPLHRFFDHVWPTSFPTLVFPVDLAIGKGRF